MFDQNSFCFREDSEFEDLLELTFEEVSYLRSEKQNLFWATHTPMVLKWLNPRTSSDNTIVTENEIYETLKSTLLYKSQEEKKKKSKKSIILISGDTGTGKSELCAYVSLRLQRELKDNFYLLPIEKDQSWLEIYSKTLVKKYDDFFKDELPEAKSFDVIGNKIKNDSKSLNQISSGLAVDILNKLIERNIVKEENSPSEILKKAIPISEYLVKKLGMLFGSVSEGKQDKARQFNIFNIEIIMKFKEQNVIAQKEVINIDDLTKEMNIILNDSIKQKFNIRAINEILKSFHQKLIEQGSQKKILLIIEDYGLIGNDSIQFKNFMITDPYQSFDFLIAGTEDMINPLIDSTTKERGNIYSTSIAHNKETLFLTNRSVADFIGKYISFFKRNLPSCINCENNFRCQERMFPFTKFFLERLFLNLEGKDLQPRSFIKIISDILTYFKGKVYPFDLATDDFKYKPAYSIDQELLKKIPSEFINFVKWYGKNNIQEIVIEKEICDFFSINLKSIQNVSLISYDDANLMSIIDARDSGDNTALSGDSSSTGSINIVVIDPDEKIFNEIFDSKIANYDRWFNNPVNENKEIEDFKKYLIIGLKQILKILDVENIFDLFILNRDDPLDDIFFKKLSISPELDPYSYLYRFEGIDIDQFDKKFFEYLLKIGILVYEKDLKLDSLKNEIVNTTISNYFRYLSYYLEKIKTTLFTTLTYQLLKILFTNDGNQVFGLDSESRLSYSQSLDVFTNILLFFIYIYTFIANPICNLNNPENLQDFIFNTSEFTNKSPLSLSLPKNLKSIEKMKNYQEIIIDMFKKLISKEIFYEKFNISFSKNSPYTVIDLLFDATRRTNREPLRIFSYLSFKKKYNNKKIKNFFDNFITIKRNIEQFNKNTNFESNYEKFEKDYILILKKLSKFDKDLIDGAINSSYYLNEHPTIKKDIKKFKEELNSDFFQNLNPFLASVDNIFKVRTLKSLMLEQLENILSKNILIKTYKTLEAKLSDVDLELNLKPLEELSDIL